MEDSWFKANIHYYCREKLYNHMYKIAKSACLKYPDNVEYPFYRGISLVLQGQAQRGIDELSPLQSNKDVQLGIILALIYANKRLMSIDKELLHNLDSKLKEERKHASAFALYYAALFLSLAEKYEKAAEYIVKSLKKDANNLDTIILKGWNELFFNKVTTTNASDCFDLVLNKSENHIEAMLGLAKVRYLNRNHDSSNLLLDKIIVKNVGQIVPIVEKIKNDLSMKKWDAVSDTMERVFLMNPENIEALKAQIFLTLCKNGDLVYVIEQLNRYYFCLETVEPLNGFQFFNISKLVSRTCGRSSTVLSQAYRLIQRASELYPTNIEYLTEIGNNCLLQGKSKDAHNFFKAASKIDSNSLATLCGLTLSQMLETGPTEQIEQQVELLLEMQGSVKSPLLQLLSAKLAKKDTNKATAFLNEAISIKIREADEHPYGIDYVIKLDPDFIMEVYKEYQHHLPKKPFIIVDSLPYSEDTANPILKSCFEILEAVKNACPGLVVVLYELAKLKFVFGFASEAQKLAQQILEIDNTHTGSYVLLAQIFLQQQLYQKAAQNLEMCMSYNFTVRDSAMYHLINGIIQKNTNDNQEALNSFTTSLQILNGKNTSTSVKLQDPELNIVDRATLYLQLIEVRTSLGQFSEAGKLMQDAIQQFSFTTEEGRLVLAKAELALRNGDIDRAIELLNEVKFGHPYYLQAHTKMAHIYLKEKNDRAMFTNCFRDIVSKQPMTDSHVMMGDAYMSINEPHLAVEAYESGIATNPTSVSLIKKLAAAYVKTHHFNKAMQLYEDSIKLVSDEDLKFAYAELLIKLKQYEKADAFVTRQLEGLSAESELSTLRCRVRLLLLQSRAREARGVDTALVLMEARQLQVAILKRMQLDSIGDIGEEKRVLSRVLCSLARVKSGREPAVAANLYAEALVNTPRDPHTLLALANLYAQMNNAERCEQTCSILLSTDPNNEDAAIMMADLAFRKVDFESAERHLSRVLRVNGRCWRALAQLVEVEWRRGRRAAAEEALRRAADCLHPGETQPGYYLCAGLVSAFAGRPSEALRLLNQCRRSPEWGAEAARRMVLLCLAHNSDESDPDERGGLALRTAEKLLSEVSARHVRGLSALLALVPRSKSQADRVLQDLLPTVNEDDDPYVILAVANAYSILKQPTRAKNILKRTISNIPWTPENADGLERCWLEVVAQQLGAGRHEAARELLHTVVKHNQSCSQAYQYLGYLSEKEQNFKQAALYYDNAWNNSNKSNLNVGYKLAQCHLKMKKYPEAIVICRRVLREQPDYPKIRKEIYEKARNNLRT